MGETKTESMKGKGQVHPMERPITVNVVSAQGSLQMQVPSPWGHRAHLGVSENAQGGLGHHRPMVVQ